MCKCVVCADDLEMFPGWVGALQGCTIQKGEPCKDCTLCEGRRYANMVFQSDPDGCMLLAVPPLQDAALTQHSECVQKAILLALV